MGSKFAAAFHGADLPAMRTLKRTVADLAHPFAGWLADAVDGAYGRDTADRRRIVAATEAEGAALVGALPCRAAHGVEVADPELPILVGAPGPCRACGAEV